MRSGLVFGLVVVMTASAQAQQAAKENPPAARYGLEASLRNYPQSTPKEALQSVLTAIDNGRIDYLLAHLSDPTFVDQRVKDVYGGKFDEVVRETTSKLADNPGTVKELRRFLKDGEWDVGDTSASAKLKDIKDRQVYMKKIGSRWFLENRQKPEAAKTEQ
jgi:hypothetical protein